MDNIADVTISNAYSDFGFSMASAGDVNADGFSDIVVGQNTYFTGTNINAGRAYIFFGGIFMDDVPDVKISGEAAYNNFGCSVSSAGDVNGDGFSDVIVGASSFNSGWGKAYIFFGGASMDSIPEVTMLGSVDSYFGRSVASAGDVNGDGFSDVIVGADYYSTEIGAAYIYFGSVNMNNYSDVTLYGETTYDYFGRSVSAAGDVNRDGFSDVIVGAPGHNSTRGKAYLYLGGVVIDNIADITISGLEGYLGNSVSAAGDVNGDGFSDFMIGQYQYPNNPTSWGRTYIFFGGALINNTPDITFTGEVQFGRLGTSISTAGDINRDGLSDVIVGSNSGKAYLFMSTSTEVNPGIISVKDVPFDQGGKVKLKWHKSGYDTRELSVVTHYLIYRSDPPGITGYEWEQIGNVSSAYQNIYTFTANTNYDSTGNTSGTFYFKVAARTVNLQEIWESNIMSGYSVDNLAPFAPAGLVAAPNNNSIYLTWNPNGESDLHHYNIYRDGNVIATSVNNNFDDAAVFEDSTYDYQIAAVDIHGNISQLSNLVSSTLNNSGTLNLTIIMEGFYDAALNSMRTSDTLRIYLRNSTSPYAIVDSSKAIIDANTLTGSFQINNAPNGTYYIQIRHRNTIETWSSSAISYTEGATSSYNFITSSSQAYGNNMIQVDATPVRFAIYSGDVNQDGIIDAGDVSQVDNDAFNSVSGYVATDVTGDDYVDASDLSIVDNNAFNGVIVMRP